MTKVIGMKTGDICLGAFFELVDAEDDKLRPVLIVSEDRFNRGEDVVILPISHSADPRDPHVYEIDPNAPAFRLTGLKRVPSSVRWTKPFTVPKGMLKKKLGALQRDMFNIVRDKLKSVFSYPTSSSSAAK